MKLFLSYASENGPVAEEISLALAGAGHDVFFDKPKLNPGDDYNQRIRDSIAEADGMVFLISPQSIEAGRYTLTELKFARRKWIHPKQRILPVLVKPTPIEKIPVYLKSVTILEPEGNIAAEVVEALEHKVTPEPKANNTTSAFSQVKSLSAIFLTGVFIALGLGTLFSIIYPRVEIDFSLAALFLIVGMLLVFATRGVWRTIWRTRR